MPIRSRTSTILAICCACMLHGLAAGCAPGGERRGPDATERGDAPPRVRFERTDILVEGSDERGGHAVVWSHDGAWLAWLHGNSILVAPDADRSAPVKIYSGYDSVTAGGEIRQMAEGGSLVFAPDNRTIGFLLTDYDSLMRAHVPTFETIDRITRKITIPVIGIASVFDWSAENIIAGEAVWRLASRDLRTDSLRLTRYPVDSGWTYAASAPGRKLLVVRYRERAGLMEAHRFGGNGTMELYDIETRAGQVVKEGGKPVEMIGTIRYPSRPVVSPDGWWIAWIEHDTAGEGGEHWRIILHDRRRERSTAIADSRDQGTGRWKSLAWAPDGKRLAFTFDDETIDSPVEARLGILHLE